MQNTRFNYLFERYFKGLATLEESNEFLDIVEDDLNKEYVQELMEVYWNSAVADREIFFSDLQGARMFAAIFNTEQVAVIKPTYKLWPRIVAIAAAVAVIVSGVYFFNYDNKPDETQTRAYTNDFAPGKVGATLTLANGNKIKLDNVANGEIAKQAGISVTKTADGQLVYKINPAGHEGTTNQTYNTLATAKGETYILILPDKSKVWMNAASSLTYSARLNEDGKRRVKLNGEAYFEIAKDKIHPFIVESAGQEVEVLGTHFNVNAYSNEPAVRTTLLEGSVAVRQSAGQSAILKPGQQAILADTRKLTVSNVDANEIIAWKNGKFIFTNETIESIMRKLSRWYDVEVEYKYVPEFNDFSGSMSRFENISQVLRKIEMTNKVHFEIKGRRITVMK